MGVASLHPSYEAGNALRSCVHRPHHRIESLPALGGRSMKIVIVGSGGYIGRHVVTHLAAERAEIVAFDLVPAPAQWCVPGVPFIQGNMTNLEEVMSAIVDHGIERIVALGYFMTPLLAPECRDLLNAARVNIIGITNLFEAARWRISSASSSPARLESLATRT